MAKAMKKALVTKKTSSNVLGKNYWNHKGIVSSSSALLPKLDQVVIRLDGSVSTCDITRVKADNGLMVGLIKGTKVKVYKVGGYWKEYK